MLSDGQIKRLLHQTAGDATDIMFREEVRAFARACYAEGQRDAQVRIAELELEIAAMREEGGE